MNKLFLLFSLIALIGCAGPAGPTKAEIWNARIGTYTYAEAVGEFGPPDNKETLDEDVLVASWVTTKKTLQGLLL